MDDPTSPGARMRKRAFLNEQRRLKNRTGGVTPRHDAILEGVVIANIVEAVRDACVVQG